MPKENTITRRGVQIAKTFTPTPRDKQEVHINDKQFKELNDKLDSLDEQLTEMKSMVEEVIDSWK